MDEKTGNNNWTACTKRSFRIQVNYKYTCFKSLYKHTTVNALQTSAPRTHTHPRTPTHPHTHTHTHNLSMGSCDMQWSISNQVLSIYIGTIADEEIGVAEVTILACLHNIREKRCINNGRWEGETTKGEFAAG